MEKERATLQYKLDHYGFSCQCKDWMGWVSECIQHPDMVVGKFKEIVEEFEAENKGVVFASQQIVEATAKLKEKVYGKNWPKNVAHYKTLFGENNGPDEFLPGITEEEAEKSGNPFKQMSDLTLLQLINGVENNFSTYTKEGEAVYDHSKHLDLYLSLVKYVIQNNDRLRAVYEFTENMNYGGWIDYLLKDQIEKRRINYKKE